MSGGRPVAGVVFCIACGQCIDDDAPLCACDSERMRERLMQRIRETAPPRTPTASIGRQFERVARLAARVALSRGERAPTSRDMRQASAFVRSSGSEPPEAS